MDLDRFRNVRVCLWVSKNEYLVEQHHAYALELPPYCFVKGKDMMFMTWRPEKVAAETEFRFDKRHWENLMKEVVNQVYDKVYQKIEAIKQQWLARRNQPLMIQ